jgi:hypothetical protein
MQRREYYTPSKKQLTADEVGRWFALRHQRLHRLLGDENLLPDEKAQLTSIDVELSTLESIIADELYRLDQKLVDTTKQIESAKTSEKFGT